MTDLSNFNPNSASNPNNNIFGLPFTEDDASIVLLPVPWEVTVSYSAGTSRSPDHIFKASMQVDLFDQYCPNIWHKGYFMKDIDKKILIKSDYLRKEAELYIDYITKGSLVEDNKFMSKSLREINSGSIMMNNWVYEQTKQLLEKDKLVGLVGGDHSTALGYYKSLGEKYGSFGILQIDAHCDLRKSYEGFTYSHASIMYNASNEVPEIERLVQVGIRDYSEEEWDYACASNQKIIIYLDDQLKQRQFEGENWSSIADSIVHKLPDKIYISFDIDGLDPKLCPHTGTPVPGGLQAEQAFYLFKKIIECGKKIIGFDLVEVGVGENDWDSNVGARILFKLCNFLMQSNS